MAAVRTYGIPKVVESSELLYFNGGKGHIRVTFSGGILDPKLNIPATYSTNNPFEQLVIEGSPQFGRRIFRYNGKGQRIDASPVNAKNMVAPTPKKTGKRAPASVDETRTYKNVETIGEATEILLELGAKADELGNANAVVSAMVKYKVSFPNLKLN